MAQPNKLARIDALLIAAGSSTRLGQPKQLVLYNGIPLISHTISELQKSEIDLLYVVLGCHYDLISQVIKVNSPILYNENWESGMGSSIAYGVSQIDDEADGLLISLVDQYKQDFQLINKLISAFKLNKSRIVASRYSNGIIGVPAIFPKNKYSELINLNNDRGAGKLIKSELKENPENVKLVEFPNGFLDIDTPEDLNNI